MNIFHKELGGKKVRSRNGYDMAELNALVRKIGSVRDFIKGGSANDPILRGHGGTMVAEAGPFQQEEG